MVVAYRFKEHYFSERYVADWTYDPLLRSLFRLFVCNALEVILSYLHHLIGQGSGYMLWKMAQKYLQPFHL